MHGALEAAHYVDLGGLFHMTRRQLELAPEFERRGLMAILGMGSAPGIVNVLATLAARGLDAVREIHCLVGGIDRTRYRNMSPLWFGYSADTLLDEFTDALARLSRRQIHDGPPSRSRRARCRPLPGSRGTIPVDTTIHSEVATLPCRFVSVAFAT